MRYYCAVHDMIGNAKPSDFEKAEKGEINCFCCGREVAQDMNHAFELPEPVYVNGVIYTIGEQSVCNCFITGDKGKNYTEEEIEAYHHHTSFTWKDMEKLDIESKEQELEEEVESMFSVVLP